MADQERVSGTLNWEVMWHGRALGGMSMESALSELIDNSLDAGATTIRIGFGTSSKLPCFSIEDNGRGKDTLAPFFGLGVHDEHSAGRGKGALGVWGIGGKHATLYISRALKTSVEIVLHTRDEVRSIKATWQALAQDFNRGASVAADLDVNKSGKTGCLIRLSGTEVRLIGHGAQFDTALQKLSFRYSKAIEEGVSITLSRGASTSTAAIRQLTPSLPPDLEDGHIDEDIEIAPGKWIHVMVGVVRQGAPNERCGLHYRYSYRVIKESSADGCGDYNPARVYGTIDLLTNAARNRWNLELHKDGITDKDAKVMYAKVFERIEPLLKRAQGQHMKAEFAAVLEVATARMREAIDKTHKAKRGRGNKKGTTKPSSNGSPHGNAANKQPGATMPGGGSGRRGVSISFEELPTLTIGECRAGIVRLNTKVDLVRRNQASPEMVFTLAMAVYHVCGGESGQLSTSPEDALLNLGKCLDANAAPSLNGKRLGADFDSAPVPPIH